jgi:hypothetical protein
MPRFMFTLPDKFNKTAVLMMNAGGNQQPLVSRFITKPC